MDEEVVNRLARFRLREKEEEGVNLDQRDVKFSKDECEGSLIGRIWGDKIANFTGLRSTFDQLWCPQGSLRVIELGPNFYQFIFSHNEEKDRVLLKRPWFFDNQFLVLQKWKPRIKKDDECFCRIPLWIQILGLPHHWTSKEVGWKIGKLFPQCSNVIMSENGSKQGKILKILAEVELTKPLLRGTKINLDGEIEWVDFKYERLPGFCFYCGLVGHQEKTCETKVVDSQYGQVLERQYGEWLRTRVVKEVKGSSLLNKRELGKHSAGEFFGTLLVFEGVGGIGFASQRNLEEKDVNGEKVLQEKKVRN